MKRFTQGVRPFAKHDIDYRPVRIYPLKKIPDNLVLDMIHDHSFRQWLQMLGKVDLKRYQPTKRVKIQLTDGDVVDLRKYREIEKQRTCQECGLTDTWRFRLLRKEEQEDARFVKIEKVQNPDGTSRFLRRRII